MTLEAGRARACIRALEKTDGKRGAAARILGWVQGDVYSKIAALRHSTTDAAGVSQIAEPRISR